MKNQTVLVIGGTGSWGCGLIDEMLGKENGRIRVFARNESRMVAMMRAREDSRVEMELGDIRDKKALLRASRGVRRIFHLAALKHVPVCEALPQEAVKTNVTGTENVIEAAIENQVEKVLYVSTDKAVNADCTYGCTKFLGEKLILAANERSRTKFSVFRGGNLLGSAGSVIPLFERQIREKGSVSLTDDGMNRFFLSIPRASRLLLETAERAEGGEIFIPAMPSLKIRHIARYLLEKYHLGEERIMIGGIRPGEKLNEELVSENERQKLRRLSGEMYVISKEKAVDGSGRRGCKDFAVSSKDSILSYEEAFEFLRKEGV